MRPVVCVYVCVCVCVSRVGVIKSRTSEVHKSSEWCEHNPHHAVSEASRAGPGRPAPLLTDRLYCDGGRMRCVADWTESDTQLILQQTSCGLRCCTIMKSSPRLHLHISHVVMATTFDFVCFGLALINCSVIVTPRLPNNLQKKSLHYTVQDAYLCNVTDDTHVGHMGV